MCEQIVNFMGIIHSKTLRAYGYTLHSTREFCVLANSLHSDQPSCARFHSVYTVRLLYIYHKRKNPHASERLPERGWLDGEAIRLRQLAEGEYAVS
ncbi:hypothetical protein A2755_00355 [Candidatus Wolfebacteria bacterium RIFCSPHIGHO2_01_FULL_48_22]|uniref:Uncharacterized protein n=1 Tax=Candidatus Wolfebacteria bacterium RIFCSPHIGHO2_01_FULL_48_22 TaxID=1802555 RepID=A0A1F8DVD1_9BACT|nr:MAG: hypothetical protein A2755_00355 [Candidatus Wolfebacteria bacterium RIFCSPHIGHO2_01_FULL_48_22]